MSNSVSVNEEIFGRAKVVLPGGVNSPVRAFGSVGGTPLFIRSGSGSHITDSQSRKYIDYVCSWGPLILGHDAEVVREAVAEALVCGTSFGAPTEREVEFAELLVSILPGIEMIRMVSSGTEAMMSLARLARGYTARKYVVKCDGCYHGHADTFLVKAGSGAATQGISGSAGVPDEIASCTLSVEYNDLEKLSELLSDVGAEQVAAIVVEPVAGNMGLVQPEPGYLQGLRKLCDQHGILLIFDEVMCGFRVALGGASERFSVVPDLAAYGKVIGGGLPAAAFGGRAEIMSHLAPSGPVYQAGTLSGNPLAVAAGHAVVSYLVENNPYPRLEELGNRLMSGFKAAADNAGIDLQVSVCGSMFGYFFASEKVLNFSMAKQNNQEQFKKFFHAMLERGVYLAPSAFEAGFISCAHTDELVDQSIAAAKESIGLLV